MPELPEVENVRRSLEALVVGKVIESVEARLPRIIRTPDDPRVFEALLQGCTIEATARRGKYLLLSVPPWTLVSHLRMEGQYALATAGDAEQSHTHVVFRFTDQTELRYRDVRQFGTMDLVATEQAYPEGLRLLGPEPFDTRLTAAILHQRIHSRKAPIKAVLLNQTCIAGLGNIYVDEALFLSGIHPERPADRVTKSEATKLLADIRDVLGRAIHAGGTSIKTFVNGYGRHGGFQMELNVYAREGQPCRVCGSEIVKLRVAGRGTHVCLHCQGTPHKRRRTRIVRSGNGEKAVDESGMRDSRTRDTQTRNTRKSSTSEGGTAE